MSGLSMLAGGADALIAPPSLRVCNSTLMKGTETIIANAEESSLNLHHCAFYFYCLSAIEITRCYILTVMEVIILHLWCGNFPTGAHAADL